MKSANDIRKLFSFTFAPDKNNQDTAMRKLCDQLSQFVAINNRFADKVLVDGNDEALYVPKPIIVARELSDAPIGTHDYAVLVNGLIGTYDDRDQDSQSGFMQRSSFASMATMQHAQTAGVYFIKAGSSMTLFAIPDYATIKAVAYMVTEAIAGPSSFTIRSSTGTSFKTTISTALNSKGIARSNCPYEVGTSESLELIFTGTPATGAGMIEIVMFYELISQS